MAAATVLGRIAATALYSEGGEIRRVWLRAYKSSPAHGVTWRWLDDSGRARDGLRHDWYSVAYQLRHARGHACFSGIREAVTLTCDKPLAALGLTSYRCRGAYGWIMIGAKDAAEALREALRSCAACERSGLQVWDGGQYVPVDGAAAAEG